MRAAAAAHQVLLEDLRQEEEVGNSMRRHLSMVLRRLDEHLEATAVEAAPKNAIPFRPIPQLTTS